MNKAKWVFGISLFFLCVAAGVYLSGFMVLWLLKLGKVPLQWDTYWSYFRALDLPQVKPYAQRIQLAGYGGFGVPLAAATVGGLAVTGMDHTMGRMFDAQQGLSTDPLTGRYLVPEGSGAFASIPASVREQFATMSPSAVTRVQSGDNAFTVHRADGHSQWMRVDPQSGEVTAQYANPQGFVQLSMNSNQRGPVTIEQYDRQHQLLSTAVRTPEEGGNYAEEIRHADGRVVYQQLDSQGKVIASDAPAQAEPAPVRAPAQVQPVSRSEAHAEQQTAHAAPAMPAPRSHAEAPPPEPIVLHEARVKPWPGGMSFHEAHQRRDEPEDTPASSLRPVGRSAVPDRLHDLQLLREVALTQKEIWTDPRSDVSVANDRNWRMAG